MGGKNNEEDEISYAQPSKLSKDCVKRNAFFSTWEPKEIYRALVDDLKEKGLKYKESKKKMELSYTSVKVNGDDGQADEKRSCTVKVKIFLE
jgi:hypothetical protein